MGMGKQEVKRRCDLRQRTTESAFTWFHRPWVWATSHSCLTRGTPTPVGQGCLWEEKKSHGTGHWNQITANPLAHTHTVKRDTRNRARAPASSSIPTQQRSWLSSNCKSLKVIASKSQIRGSIFITGASDGLYITRKTVGSYIGQPLCLFKLVCNLGA